MDLGASRQIQELEHHTMTKTSVGPLPLVPAPRDAVVSAFLGAEDISDNRQHNSSKGRSFMRLVLQAFKMISAQQ
jgi:hypothetical protein